MASTLASEILDAMPPNFDMVPMRVSTLNPLTVYLAGSTTAVPAKALAGLPIAIGDTGYAFWKPPVPPLVLVTTS